MDNYKDKNILVIGLGFSGGGVGATKFLLQQGAKVTVVDQKTKKELKKSVSQLRQHKNLRFYFSVKSLKHRVFDTLAGFDAVVLNPAVDLRSELVQKIQKAKIPIESEIGLFLKNCKGKVIAITGTKGKGTTSSLVYEMLKRARKKVLLGGNIGGSLLYPERSQRIGPLSKITKDTFVILEISSFQLDLLRLSWPVDPAQNRRKRSRRPTFYIATLTNIYPDHLDRYDSFADYKKSKLSIFKYPANHKIHGSPISLHSRSRTSVNLPRWINAKKIKLIGEHNKKNIAIAIRIAQIIGIKKRNIVEAVYSFKGLPHRLELVCKKNGVSFYNDSYSTTPDSTIAALRSFDKKVILIVGGVSKGVSFKNLAREAKRRARTVILFGKSASEIERSFFQYPMLGKWKTLKQATREAKKIARSDDIVLFSPACASFDQFTNARERGEAFKKLVK